MILAQVAGYSIVHLLVVAIVVAACVGILVVACALAIFAIRFIASM